MLIIGIEQLRNKFCWNVVLQLLYKEETYRFTIWIWNRLCRYKDILKVLSWLKCRIFWDLQTLHHDFHKLEKGSIWVIWAKTRKVETKVHVYSYMLN